MLKVVAKMTVKENMIKDLKSIISELVEETRKEEGCISYQLFQDVNNNQIFTFIEEWQNQEVLDKHMESKHFKKAMPKLGELWEKEIEVNVYTLAL